MSRDTLLTSIYALPHFQRHLAILVKESVRQDFPGIEVDRQKEPHPVIQWRYLLSCASLLAQSKESEHQDAALRIAQSSLQLGESTDDLIRMGAATVLDSLTNNPALNLSIRRNLLPANFEELLPGPLRLDSLRRRYETGVQTKHELVQFTRFQAQVYRGALSNEWLSISAPTSAGKSFVLNRIIAHYLSSSSVSHVAYVVPTRALIQQVISDISEMNAKQNRTNIFVTAMPQVPEDHATRSCIFIVTQERMHWLLSQIPDGFSLNLLVIDEAQKIGDGSRGILLQQVLEGAVRAFPHLCVMFSSPLTTNPELLVEDVPNGRGTKYISSEQPTVNQNLIWVTQQESKTWAAHLCKGEASELLGLVKLPEEPNPESKRLPFVAFAMTQSARDGGCLIYVDTQSKAEKAAFQLSQLRDQNLGSDPDLAELIKLVKKTIHRDYLLVKVLPKGVAFHYGNMPLLIRTEIERLFKKGKIQFLVCTSTLIEGVNLPAKHIFVRGPRKGTKTPLSAAEFWNLAGRAGRLGTEFQGSVICVDPNLEQVWKEAPPTKRSTYPMKRALDDVISTHDKFLTFLEQERVENKPQRIAENEHALVYCTQVLARGETLVDHAWSKRFSRQVLETIEEKVKATIEGIDVAPSIIERNAGVSPVAQQRLLNFFRKYEKPVEQLVPYSPEIPEAVKESYSRLITNISKYLSGDTLLLTYSRAILVVNWMNGYSLSRMIAENITYWTAKGKTVPTIIRKTMEDVEQYARFSFVKFVSCYIDILTQHLTEIGRLDLIERIPQLQIYAEFGASQKTQMSLMDIGLSRIAAIELSEFIIKTDLDRAACILWLNENDLAGLSLSPILLREIETLRQGIQGG